MARRSFLFTAVCLFGGAGAFVLLVQHRGARTTLPSGPLNAQQSDGWARFERWRATEAHLGRLSATNAAFQKWGAGFMLRAANEHLVKVPLFGLSKVPLREEDVTVVSVLTQAGAEFNLATKDLKHCLYYDNGVLRKAVALEAEMTGLFRDPSKIERFAENAGPWSKEEAKRAAEALVQAKGIDLGAAGTVRGPIVRAESFNSPSPDGAPRSVTPFYTVRWLDRDGDDVLEVRFRRTASGTWEPTQWFDNTRKTRDTESTSYTNLYTRFFGTEPQ